MADGLPAWHDISPRSEVPMSKEMDRYTANSTSLCEKCSVLDYEQMRSQEGQAHHENWTKLTKSASSGCRLCTFFTLAPLHPKTSSRSVFYSDSSGPLHFKILPTYKREETCLHVCVPQDKRTAAIYYLYLSTTDNARDGQIGDIKMIDSERDRLSLTAVEKISIWLQTCQTEHHSCRWRARSKLPTRVVDISPTGISGGIRLVEGQGKPDVEYVALSHCWGNMPFNRFDLLSKCDTFNIDSLRDGIQIDLLPKLYQDAIELTRAIGKRYIWIDSLCIIQDSKEDWASECERMSDIYSNCYMVISAMSYENNERGFRHILPEDVPPHYPLCALPGHPETHVHVRSAIDHKSRIDFLKYRAWAFQELLLSPRVLHLTSTAMAFECDTYTQLERGPNSDVLYGIDTERKRLVHVASDFTGKDCNTYYDRWLQLVQSYSQLQLTYKTDRLPALSGIAYLVASKTKDTYIAGLWKEDIAAGILWYVWPCQPATPTYVAPSWSWASVTSAWTLEPTRRRFVDIKMIDVHVKLSTSNPYGEISAASLTVSGPLKRCDTKNLIKKGHRYYVLKGENLSNVRFALDTGQKNDVKSQDVWCLDCTIDKELDIGIARSTLRRETFFRPHGLLLIRLSKEEHTYKRIGVFEVFEILHKCTNWHETGFQSMTVKII
ncbi:HET-domain-containing protein [Didymella exigua CBS 183.55]|uniref:HET-domain-containing protein n=1 Tax=Didymella exigua CBS 183.55 TaxID=1150837 RepID=A0A6A5RNY2_9PLEO|nr:HET-domain-containing protein [Didymella exigua CBS 183.55]KAF1930131.1 HET-domain-containing protein [Didymella exigua CBS 183.55]